MRTRLPFLSLLLGSILLTSPAQSQSDRFAYAITDINKDGASWSFLRKIDLQNGRFSDVLLDGASNSKQMTFDAGTKKGIGPIQTDIHGRSYYEPAFNTGVAAMAYDRRNNRIWFTPMFSDQLRYVDLKSMKVYNVTSQGLTGQPNKSPDQGNIITRMTIGDDGNGYAMTNDGAHLIRFTTGKKITITDLGNLADDPASKGFSIHSSCSSFGGDMIADNEGNLFVFSARNHVFKVNIETKVATHVATISGVPGTYTTNGAAVTENNEVIISSAVDANSYYTVDTKSWKATPYVLTAGWRSSDLANSNILSTKPTATAVPEISSRRPVPSIGAEAGKIQLYPNPVTNNQFAVQFSKLKAGEYNVQVTDVMGRQVLQRIVNVSGEDHVENIRFSPAAARGFYLVKVLDKESKAVFSSKLILQ
jgi:hypothetical protein